MSIDADPAKTRTPARTRLAVTPLWAFLPYVILAIVHVAARFAENDAIAAPTKLGLMPLLILAVLWTGRGSGWGTPFTLLFLALALSWLGDGAATFLPFAPELPVMLASFGLAHICYIILFTRFLARGRVPLWAGVYAVWWVALVAILAPALLAKDGGIGWLIAIGAYGLLLGATAASAARSTPAVALGGALFLASDSILAFRLFMPDAMPEWTSGAVMLTYCAGQGLIAAGAVVVLRAKRAR